MLGPYAQRFNRRHGRRGHLFQERFKNVLVETESYLLTLSRYIVRNPVVAGMVDKPEAYRWSSARARLGLERPPQWLALETVQSRFGRNLGEARGAYRSFVYAAVDDETDLLDRAAGGMFLGTAAWIERMQALVDDEERSAEIGRAQVHVGRPELDDVLEAVAQTFDTTAQQIVTSRGTLERRVVAYLAFEEGLIRLREIARRLGLASAGGVSNLVSRCRRELEREAELREILQSCRQRMRRRPPPFRAPPAIPPVTGRRYHRASPKSRTR